MSPNEIREAINRAQAFVDSGELDDAMDLVNQILMDDPNDPRALLGAADIQERAGRLTVAYQFAERALHLAPKDSSVWLGFGRCADRLYRLQDAEMAYHTALRFARNDKQKAVALMNLGGLYVTLGNWEAAEDFSKQALELKPGNGKIKGNIAIACLAQHKWAEGWENYEAILGLAQRRRVQYTEEPEWTGEKGKKVVVYGEQGLGDEISFASMLPDLIRDSRGVVIDCDRRLEGLFKRSFPEASVYGTRWAKEGETPWSTKDCDFDASIVMGGLGKYYRLKDEDFPGKPYLIPDPNRVTMWKALFATQRPAIGIAWTGGMQHTGSKFRKWGLDDLMPIFKAVQGHWVSLQYKDASAEIAAFNKGKRTQIVQYPYGTLTKDYDDTAALVESLDLVICMQTAVAHLCGALGKECWVFVPKLSQWRYGKDEVPWYGSVKVFRQRDDGSWPFEEAAKLLQLRYARAA